MGKERQHGRMVSFIRRRSTGALRGGEIRAFFPGSGSAEGGIWAECLRAGEKRSALQVFLDQFKDLLVIILIIAAVISMISGDVESTAVIFAVLLLNAVLGTVEHQKAEKSLDSLKSLSAPMAGVLRDGRRQEILSSDVVPGDILLLEAGDMVAADGRLLETYSLLVNESS